MVICPRVVIFAASGRRAVRTVFVDHCNGIRIEVGRGSASVGEEKAQTVAETAPGAVVVTRVAGKTGVEVKRPCSQSTEIVRESVSIKPALAEPEAVPVADGNFMKVLT